MNNAVIERLHKTKFLGVIISSDLSWDHHTKYISNKVAKGVGIICKAQKRLNTKSLLSLYYSFIYPYLCYCIAVWGATTCKNLSALHKLQKKAVRVIMNTCFNAHTSDLFIDLKILNISKLYFFNVALYMFKYRTGKCPESMNNMFKYSDHFYSTRQNDCYCLPLYKYKICQSNIAYKGVTIWNHIMQIFNTHCSYHSFKNRIKQYILSNDLVDIM